MEYLVEQKEVEIYKITDGDMRTYNKYQWVLGKRERISNTDINSDLCSNAWLHAYTSLEIASFLKTYHTNFNNARIFKGIGVIGRKASDYKIGCKSIMLLEEVKFINFTTIQKVEIAIKAVKTIYTNRRWTTWADNWLNQTDITKKSADAVAADAAAAYADAAAAAAAAYAAAAADAAYVATAAAADAAYAAAAYAAAADAADAAYAATAAAAAAAAAINYYNRYLIKQSIYTGYENITAVIQNVISKKDL